MTKKEATLLLRIKEQGAEVLDEIADGYNKIKDVAMVAFGAISAVVVKAIAEFKEQQAATNELNRAMVNQGIYSRDLAKAYKEQADELAKKSLFEGEAITKSQAILQGYLGQTAVTKELMQATMDLAQAKGMDLAQASELVAKTIGTSTNALARNGIEVNANASKQEKLAQIIDAVNGKFGGQAEAATEGLGSLDMLQKIGKDLLETIGERLAPVIMLFAGKLKALGEDTATVNMLMDAFVGTLKLLTQAGVIVSGVFEAVGKVLGTTLAAALETVSQTLDGEFKKAWETSKLAANQLGDDMTSSFRNMGERLIEVDEAFATKHEESLEKVEKMEKDSMARRSIVKQETAVSDGIKAQEQLIEQQNIELQLLQAGEDRLAMAQIEAKIKTQETILKNATTSQQKLAALNEIHRLGELKREEIIDQQRIANRAQTLSTIATLQNSNNKVLATAGKAAGATQIAIDTPVAISKALSAFPPPANFVAAGLVGTAMAAQAAQIAGVPLAEGGVVMPRPGGTQATIGEAGEPEAVVPLSKAGDMGFGGGGGVTINVYGGLLGDASSAREFAIAVDRELLSLRQNNESVSFDRVV